MVIAWAFLIHVTLYPRRSIPRRLLAMQADLWILTYVMSTGGEPMAVWYLIYLWVTFGNGFRYGNRFLFVSALVSLAGFSVVFYASSFWSRHPFIAAGLLVALIILPAYVATLIRKLTEAKKQAEEANRSKSRFLANMSHEIRTPLNGIIGMTDLLKGSPMTSEQKDMLRTIATSGRTLLSLINDILDFSKIEAGKLTSERVDFDLHTEIASIRAILMPQAIEKRLPLTVHVSSRVPFALRGDMLHLRQVLINLVANAVKFTSEGHVSITVDLAEQQGHRVLLRFEVEDTGIGISPDAQKRIFESFTQADETTTRRYGGTGLGLAIAKQLVELTGGRIGVESEVGRGSRFFFTSRFESRVAAERPQLDATGRPLCVLTPTAELAETLGAKIGALGFGDFLVAVTVEGLAERLDETSSSERPMIFVDAAAGIDIAALVEATRGAPSAKPPSLILIGDAAAAGAEGLRPFASHVSLPIGDEALFNALHVALVDDAAQEAADRRQEMLQAAFPASARRGLRILVAEDNRTNRKVVAKILERAGHSPQLVEDGDQALSAMDEGGFDLVLMDVNMPNMSGLEVAKFYRFSHMGEAHLPIIALTADATDESREKCAEAGMDAHITKPVEAVRLLELIDRLVPPDRQAATAVGADDGGGGPIHISAHPQFQQAPLDPAAIDDLQELGAGSSFFSDLVYDFFQDADALLGDLDLAIEEASLVKIREASHALRSCSGNIGALVLRELLGRTRDVTRENITTEGPALVQELRQEYGRVRRALTQRLSEAEAAAAGS